MMSYTTMMESSRSAVSENFGVYLAFKQTHNVLTILVPVVYFHLAPPPSLNNNLYRDAYCGLVIHNQVLSVLRRVSDGTSKTLSNLGTKEKPAHLAHPNHNIKHRRLLASSLVTSQL